MVESDTNRLRMSASYQRSLITGGLALRKERINAAAQNLNVSERTLRDWIKGKFTLTQDAFDYFLCGRDEYKKYAEPVDKYWYAKKGARIGGLTKYKKYGYVSNDEDKRAINWKKWWKNEGFKKCSFIGKTKPFSAPKFSAELSELTGIILGDGGISKYQLVITLNSVDDAEYRKYVSNLMKKMFGIIPKEYFDKNAKAVDLVISRKLLIDFLIKKVGLMVGNKTQNQVSVPKWIIINKAFSRKCLRGLIDTDGSVVIHKYTIKGKRYSYKKIDFVSASRPLVDFAHVTLSRLNIKARLAGDRHVWIDSQDGIKKYFKVVGTSNPKHLMRFAK